MVRATNPREIPPYAESIIKDAVIKSGSPIAIAEHFGDQQVVRWGLAHEDRPVHILEYHESRRMDRVHHLLHMSYEISRLWSVPAHERTIMKPTPQEPITEDMFRSEWDGIDEQTRCHLYTWLNEIPTWIRIERELWHDVPAHRERQRRFLHWHVAVTDEAIAADWDPDNEHPTYLPVTAMTVLMSDEAASITGLDRGYFGKSSRLKPTIDDLRDRLNAVREPGYLGDKRVIDSWVDCFGLRGRYAWQPMFEEEES